MAPTSATASRRFLFLLLERFTLVSFSAAVEPLRLANRVSGRPLYEWQLIGEGGTAARCSAAIPLALDGGLQTPLRRDDTLVVCGGIDVAAACNRTVTGYLRRSARQVAAVAGLCTGAWALAQAGLLDGRRATIHWENHDGFAEAFPAVAVERSLFVDDGSRLTAAGGTSPVDLMLHLIGREHGRDLATAVADQLIATRVRTSGDSQRLAIADRIGTAHHRLAAVIARIEANLEEPISPAILARDAGISPRQLERLFAQHLNRSPKRYYMEARLARARNLLMQTQMPVLEVALACGFTSSAHFSKCYQAQFGLTPLRARRAAARPAPAADTMARPADDPAP